MLAFGAESATAFARSRTIEALVLNRSTRYLTRNVCVDFAVPTITGHARLSGDTGWDQNDLSTSQALLQTIVLWGIAFNGTSGVDMTAIGGNACRQCKLIEAEHIGCALFEPGAPRISYSASSVTRGLSFINRDNGCPIPPPAPRIATLESYGYRLACLPQRLGA